MAKLKTKDIKSLSEKEKDKKILELKAELIKAKANLGKTNLREIKKAIARVKTLKE